MRTIIFLIAVLWALAVASVVFAHEYSYRATVVSVYDGDTVTLNVDLGFDIWMTNERVRLYCLNTPEITGAEKPEGLAVRQHLLDLMPVGSEVEIRTIKDRTGKFGRYLVVIYLQGQDESLNARLLREGKARVMAFSRRDREACAQLR